MIRMTACSTCCRTHNRGKFTPAFAFQLKGAEIKAPEVTIVPSRISEEIVRHKNNQVHWVVMERTFTHVVVVNGAKTKSVKFDSFRKYWRAV